MSTESRMVLIPRTDLEKWIDRIGIPKDTRDAMQSRLDKHDIESLVSTPESPPTVAWAWRRDPSAGWALGHIEPTQANLHLLDKPDEWAKVQVRRLVFGHE